MTILELIEKTRSEAISSSSEDINKAFDELIETLNDSGLISSAELLEYGKLNAPSYPLAGGTAIFKGKKPKTIFFSESDEVNVTTWKGVVETILNKAAENPACLKAMQDNCGRISGKQRKILDNSGDNMRSPIKINDSLFFEAHYDTESLLNIMMHRVLDVVGYDYSKIKVSIRSEWTKPRVNKQDRG